MGQRLDEIYDNETEVEGSHYKKDAAMAPFFTF